MSETLVQEKTLTEYGFEKGYLQNKEVFLRPIPGKQQTLITKDVVSAHSFMYEGAQLDFCLPTNDRHDYFNPFDSDDERIFFEKMIGRDLKAIFRDPNCFWHDTTFKVSITVTSEIKNIGYRMDLRNPTDVLRYKLLKKQYDIAPDMESVEKRRMQHWKWVLVDSEYKDTSKAKAADSKINAYKAFAKMEDHTDKMVEFLNLYFANNKIMQEVADNTSITALKSMIEEIITTNIDNFIATTQDPKFEIKNLIIKGWKQGGIQKHGINSFSFPGGLKYNFEEFADYVQMVKDGQEEEYLKLLAHLNMKNKIAKKTE